MQWQKPENILHGGRKQSLVADDGKSIATVVQLPGTMTRGYIYSPVSSTVDEPTWELCIARVSDTVGLTSGAYRKQREADATPTVITTPSNHPDWI